MVGALTLQNKACNGLDGVFFSAHQGGREDEKERADEQTLKEADLTYQSNKLTLWQFPSALFGLKCTYCVQWFWAEEPNPAS